MGHRSHYHRLTSCFVGILTLITVGLVSPTTTSAQTRIISLSGDMDFGTIPLGTSAQRTLIISNTGDSTLTVTNIYFPPLPVLEQVFFQGAWSGTIPPGGAEFVPITFTPLGTTINGGTNDLDFQGYLYVASDATSGTSSILMSGIGKWPRVNASLDLDFGSVAIGNNHFVTLLLTNIGTAPVTISNTTQIDGFFGPFFGSSATIEPGSATNFDMVFFPWIATNYQETAIFASDATDPALVLMTPSGNVTNSDLGYIAFGVSGSGVLPAGKFVGLFAPTNDAVFENSGYITATATAKGKINATLTLANKRYPFSSQISPSGAVSATIKRRKLPDLNVSLQFMTDFRQQWSGTIDDGTWTSAVKMEPIVHLTKQSLRNVPVGQYPISLSGSTNALNAPTEPGTATLDVKTSGAVRIKGILGDGNKYSQNTLVCNSDIPFYTPLYGGKGALLGWISVASGLRPPPPDGFQLTNIITIPPWTNPVVIGPFTNNPIIIPIIGPGETNPVVVISFTNNPTRILPISTNPPVIFAPITNGPIGFLPQRSTQIERQIIGTLNWFKPAGIDPDYPDGFSFQTTVTGTIP